MGLDLLEPPVAKKPPKAPDPIPEPESSNRKPMIVQLRGTAEYKAWAEAFADREGDTLAKLFDRAVRKLARDSGFRDPPKR